MNLREDLLRGIFSYGYCSFVYEIYTITFGKILRFCHLMDMFVVIELRVTFDNSFEKPSAIQQRAIIPCCQGMILINRDGSFFTYYIYLMRKVSF